ncbi:hypothetical protein ACHWQZ_G003635 [Mnemiopsis leidyi]
MFRKAGSEAAHYWGGDVVYSHFQAFHQQPQYGDIKLSLSEAKAMLLRGSKTLKINKIQVHGVCKKNAMPGFANIKAQLSTPDGYMVLIMTSDQTWWTLSVGSSLVDPGALHLCRLDDYTSEIHDVEKGHVTPGVFYDTLSWVVRWDDSNSSVEQVFRWLDQKYIMETQFEGEPGDTLLFAKNCFNKLAKTKTWERLQGLLRSPSTLSGGDSWTSKIRFVTPDGREEFEDEQIEDLRVRVDPDGSCMVVKVMVYKVPLSEKYWTNLLLFHSYVVLQTRSSEGEVFWWSLEKNAQCIALQRGPTEPSVRDWLGGEKRCRSWFYWKPQLVGDDICADFALADIIRLLHENDELSINYHGTTENCQTFAKVVFDKLAVSKELDYGILPQGSTRVNRLLTGYRNPRPINTS